MADQSRNDLAERLEARAKSADANRIIQNAEGKAYYNGISTAFRIAAQLARASSDPEPEGDARVDDRVDEYSVRQALDMAEVSGNQIEEVCEILFDPAPSEPEGGESR